MLIHGAMFQNATSEEKREVKRLKKRTYTLFLTSPPAATTHSRFTLLTEFHAFASLPLEQMASARNVLCGSAKAQVIHTQKSGKDSKMLRLFASDSAVPRSGNLSTRHWSHQTGASSSRGGWVEAWQPAGFENGSGIKALIDAPEGRSTSRSVRTWLMCLTSTGFSNVISYVGAAHFLYLLESTHHLLGGNLSANPKCPAS